MSVCLTVIPICFESRPVDLALMMSLVAELQCGRDGARVV